MLEKIFNLWDQVNLLGEKIPLVQKINALDKRVAKWSDNKAERSRQKQLIKLTDRASRELSSNTDELNLLQSYVKTRALLRDLYPLLREQNPIINSPSKWIDADGNQVEKEFHRLRNEMAQRYPGELKRRDKIDELLPFGLA